MGMRRLNSSHRHDYGGSTTITGVERSNVKDSARGPEEQHDSVRSLARRANVFESWLSSYRGRLALICGDGTNLNSARQDNRARDVESVPEPHTRE